MKQRRILMLPGPNETYPEILESIQRMVLPHYGDIWNEMYSETCEEMKKIFMTKSDVIIWPASGASATELVAANIVESGDKVINVNTGFFGKNFEDKIKDNGGKVVSVESEFGRSVDLEKIREAIRENRDVKAIFVVHNETSSGALNPIKEIGEIAEEYDLLYIVDAISSLCGSELRMDDWNIDVCVGYASKCLGSLPALAPIAINEKVWELVEKRRQLVKPYFLNLPTWKTFRWGGPHPLTMPTLNVLALRMAINLALKEGLSKRFRRHYIAGKATREGVRAMGLKVLPREEEAADSVTGVLVPEGMESKIRSLMEEKFNIMVGGSLGEYGKDKLLRIGHMGVTASPEYVVPTIYALEQVVNELNISSSGGEGVKAAMEVFKENNEEWINSLLTRFSFKTLPENL